LTKNRGYVKTDKQVGKTKGSFRCIIDEEAGVCLSGYN